MISAEDRRETAVILERDFTLDRPLEQVRSARWLATAHGVFEARINDKPTSTALLAPGWTAYEWRLPVSCDLVSELLAPQNRIEVLVGNGWWRGDLGFNEMNLNYGEELGLLAHLEIEFSDGHVQSISTDEGWTARRSDIIANNLYDGQAIDARLRQLRHELPIRVIDFDRSRLVPSVAPRISRQEVVSALEITKSPSGASIVDFGQNLVGHVKLRARGRQGDRVIVRHAEVLEDGELSTRPLRSAKATDTFILSGGDDEFEPTLTFHGFRYAAVTGFPGELRIEDIEAVVVHSDMTRTGWFTCSSELVNALVENSIWAQRGNFLSLPTDCPQRDERMGWTGDIAVYAPTACFQFDIADFLHNWLLDLIAETSHSESRTVPAIVPDLLKLGDGLEGPDPTMSVSPTAVWGDAAVWVPQALWLAYGDRERLAEHYQAIALHLNSVATRVSKSGLWDQGYQWGDWLDPDAAPHEPGAAKADPGVVATACLVRSATFAAQAATVLELDEDAVRWTTLAEQTRAAFVKHYLLPDGRIQSDCATVYALAICFDVLEGTARENAGRRLAEVVREQDYLISTGFAGTPYVTWALSETGYVDDAYALLLQTRCPSWLYPVTMGATTIWERWDSLLPDGTVNPGDMTSFNHYALGAVADWLYQVVAGIRPAEPGYARVRIAPKPGPGLEWAWARLESPVGPVESSWQRAGDQILVRIVIPDGIKAEVALADGSESVVGAGEHLFTYTEAKTK